MISSVEIKCLLMTTKGHLDILRNNMIRELKICDTKIISNFTQENLTTESSRDSQIKTTLADTDKNAYHCVKTLNNIKAANRLFKCVEILELNINTICIAQKTVKGTYDNNLDRINELKPYIAAIIYSSYFINIRTIQDFTNYFGKIIDLKFVQDCKNGQYVDSEIKGFLDNIYPNEKQINQYVSDFIDRSKKTSNSVCDTKSLVNTPNSVQSKIQVNTPDIIKKDDTKSIEINVKEKLKRSLSVTDEGKNASDFESKVQIHKSQFVESRASEEIEMVRSKTVYTEKSSKENSTIKKDSIENDIQDFLEQFAT